MRIACAPRGRVLQRGAALAALLVLGLLLEACAGAGGGSRSNLGNARVAGGSPRGDAEAPREAPGRPEAASGSAASGSLPGVADGRKLWPGLVGARGTLDPAELSAVYRFIVEAFVDRVDHAALIAAANGGVRELVQSSGALPIDLAPFDLAPPPAGNPERDWQRFLEAYDAALRTHRGWAASRRPDWAVLRRMLASLGDSGSVFIEPESVKRLAETNYGGIGVRLAKPSQEEPPVIMEVFQNSPAARAGLRPGDRITAVDGKPTAGLSVTEVTSGVRGPQGTPVKVAVARGGQPALETPVMRAPVEPPDVQFGFIADVVGVIRVRTFAESVPEIVQRILVQGRGRGTQAWVLDLRGNSGNELNVAAQVAANWVDNRPIGIGVDRNGERRLINAVGRAAIPRAPLIVLVDRETSAAAETLAAAIKEYGVGRVVGAPTAGDGGIKVARRLSDGSAVQLTIARLLTPGGASFDKVGVQPDIPVERTIADLERGEDPQLQRALEVLAGRSG